MDAKLLVTSQCNFACPACDEKSGPEGKLTSNSGRAIVDFLLAQPDIPELHIILQGGEPLLEVEVVTAIIEHGLTQARKKKRAIAFTVVTNGSPLTDSWLHFCRECGVQLVLYVCSRRYLGSRIWPIENMKDDPSVPVLRHLQEAATRLTVHGYHQAHLTLLPGHVAGLPRLIRFLSDQGLRNFSIEADLSQTWTQTEWTRLAEAYDDLGDLHIEHMRKGQLWNVSFIEEKLRTGIRRKPLAYCGAGTSRITVDPKGRIYACLENGVNPEEMLLGDIVSGFQAKACERFQNLGAMQDKTSCSACHLSPRCYHHCITLNLASTGEPTHAPEVSCTYEQLTIAIADRVGSRLYEEKSPLFLRHYYHAAHTHPTVAGNLSAQKETERPVFGLQWHLTARCSQQCRHCYVLDSPAYASEIANEMSFGTYAQIMDNFVTTLRRWQVWGHINFTGGDPLLREDLFAILARAKSYPEIQRISILGNPHLVTPKVARQLKEHGVAFYQISIDGMETTHDAGRQPGSFREALRALQTLKEAGILTGIMFTLFGKSNTEELFDVIHLAVDHKVSHFAFDRVVPIGRGERLNEESLTAQELRDLIHRTAQEYRRLAGRGTQFARKSHLWKLYYQEHGLLPPLPGNNSDVIYSGCSAGYNSLAILADGTVYPCRRLPILVGKFPEQNFEDVFVKSKALCEIRDIQRFKKCVQCDLLPVCRGCPAVARAVTGDIFGADPHCWKVIPQTEGTIHGV